MVHSLDIVSVRIEHEGAIVTRMIGSLARGAVIATASRQCRLVKSIDSRAVPGLESQVNPARRVTRIQPELVGRQVVRRFGDLDIQDSEDRLVEAPSRFKVARTQMDMIDQTTQVKAHGRPSRRLGRSLNR